MSTFFFVCTPSWGDVFGRSRGSDTKGAVQTDSFPKQFLENSFHLLLNCCIWIVIPPFEPVINREQSVVVFLAVSTFEHPYCLQAGCSDVCKAESIVCDHARIIMDNHKGNSSAHCAPPRLASSTTAKIIHNHTRQFATPSLQRNWLLCSASPTPHANDAIRRENKNLF
jgi:hypothetical protein